MAGLYIMINHASVISIFYIIMKLLKAAIGSYSN